MSTYEHCVRAGSCKITRKMHCRGAFGVIKTKLPHISSRELSPEVEHGPHYWDAASASAAGPSRAAFFRTPQLTGVCVADHGNKSGERMENVESQ